jgi:hypothetical protein
MKIRNGFVSNSSSSSFVIQVNGGAEKCPTCGHTPQSVVDLFKGKCNRSCDDSDLEDFGELMDELEDELNSAKSTLAELSLRDPEESTYPQWDSNTKVKQSIEWTKEEIEELEKRIAKFKKVEAAGHTVYRLSLSYHDDLASHVFDENVAAGIITILEGND